LKEELMRETTLEAYKQLVEEQGQALLDVVQSVALGDLDVEVQVPEGVEILADLAVGLAMMIDDIREMLAEQQRARAEVEAARRQLEVALKEMQAAQRRYLQQEWESYTTTTQACQGYLHSESEAEPTVEAWLPVMTTAVQQLNTAIESDEQEGLTLAAPIQLHGETIGVLGFSCEETGAWSDDKIAVVESVVEQVALALENQRLFDEQQEASFLLRGRIKELDCLNDIGRKTEETPPLSEFLQWVAERIPPATRYPEVCVAAIEFEGQIYGAAEAVDLPCQIVQGLHVGGESVGRVYIAYTEERDFQDGESTLLGGVIRRVSGYIENRRLFEQTRAALAEAQQSERLLRSVIDATPDWIFVKDQEHRFRLVNQGFTGSLHLTPEDLIGKNDLDLGFPEELVKGDPEKGIRGFWADDRQVMDSDEPMVIPYDLVTVDDELRVLNTIKTPLHDAEGNVWGVLGFGRDVTERERLLTDLARRSTQLQTAAEVSRAASGILNPDELMRQVVNLVRERFELYYAGLFLVDQTGEWTGEAGQWAVLRAGTGEAGRIQLERGHKLEMGGESMVGWCVVNKQARIALDVGEEAVRFENPLLPETRSEMALPLIVRGQVIGAMTVQSIQEAAFSDEDVAVLQTMADQVAVAIENARLLAETQRALQEVRSLHQHYLRQEWEGFLTSRGGEEGIGYVLTQDGLKPVPQIWSPEIELAVQNRQSVVLTDADDAPLPGQDGEGDGDGYQLPPRARSALASPITLRGEVIGTLDVFDPDQLRDWTEDDLALVDAVTSQVALAVENARLFEQTQVALAETEALYRASRHITTATNLPDLYQVMVDEMASRLGADQCRLVMFDHKTGNSEVVAKYRPTTDEEKTFAPLVSDPSYMILRDTKQPLAIEDVSVHPAMAHFRDVLVQQNIKSMLLVPIVVRGELIGSVWLDAVGQERVFTEAELDFSQTLASQAAIAIANMRAFEEQKEITERLREVDKLKTQFLANMSHELRTPLNSIIGFSRVILKGIDGPLTELQKTDLAAIYNSGQHLLGLINDILDVSKIEAGKMELNFEEVDLKPIIKGVMSSAVGLVKDKPVELEQYVSEDMPIIWADGTRVRQVLLNLVSNAAKFTEEGKITLTTGYDDEWVTISVADTGIGIPQEKLGSIFEEFTQVDGSTTRRVGGTGLGLPISHRFVELHGGNITVESQEGLGSVFTVTLPIHPQAERKEQAATDQATDETFATDNRLVLAVDDDPGVISLYRRYLEGEGYQVVGVTNSYEVLEKAKEFQPFAITLDVLMPGKDGWQVLQELKECPETQDIPIIVCSIVSDEGRGFSLGAADYLVKPIMEEELLAALSRLDQRAEETKVLVIDDQADDILLIRRILEAQHGYRVIEAGGGQSGIDLVHQCKPDIIILDLMMPEIDGFAVLEALKREPETRSIPVIVVTAKELTEEERQRLSGQVEVLLHKGLFTEHELLEDLGRALSRLEARQPE
jgi:PAS domain S-box-containing protein